MTDREQRAATLRANIEAVKAEEIRYSLQTPARNLTKKYLEDSAAWSGLLEESEAARLQSEAELQRRFLHVLELEERIKELETLLQPFADYINWRDGLANEECDKLPDDEGIETNMLTMGDCRRAAEALQKGQTE